MYARSTAFRATDGKCTSTRLHVRTVVRASLRARSPLFSLSRTSLKSGKASLLRTLAFSSNEAFQSKVEESTTELWSQDLQRIELLLVFFRAGPHMSDIRGLALKKPAQEYFEMWKPAGALRCTTEGPKRVLALPRLCVVPTQSMLV